MPTFTVKAEDAAAGAYPHTRGNPILDMENGVLAQFLSGLSGLWDGNLEIKLSNAALLLVGPLHAAPDVLPMRFGAAPTVPFLNSLAAIAESALPAAQAPAKTFDSATQTLRTVLAAAGAPSHATPGDFQAC